MNPPIPEPAALPHELIRGPRPTALKYFIFGDLFLTAVGGLYGDGPMSDPAYLVAYLALNAISLMLFRFLWQGRNWARIVIMVLCFCSVSGIFWMQEYSVLQKVLTIANAVFSIIWFWWLQTPAVVAFTKGKPVLNAAN